MLNFSTMKRCKAISLAALLSLASFVLAAQPYGLASRPSFQPFNGGKLPPAAPTFSGDWSAVVAFPNLTFLNPMGLLPVPGTSNLMVWEREGRIYQFAKDRNTSTKTLVLDISRQCQGWDDSGLMGIAFHPGFATNRYLFIYYTYTTPGTVLGNANQRPPTDTPNRDRLERYVVDANGVADPASVTIFIDQRSETVWHNGGGMFFHPKDGFLYLTNGDDARGVNDQRINYSLHSGVLRIDVDQRGGAISHPIPKQPLPAGSKTANYFIPNDNPFVGQTGVLEEFFAIGLRSPHRMTIDPPTGRIFIGDVGEGSFEELDMITPGDPSGLNFQWNRIEGQNQHLTPPYIGVDRPPLLFYPHSEGSAIIGGYVYRGKEFAADLGGKYIFGDNIANVVWLLDESTAPASKKLLCVMPRGSGPNSGNDYVGLSSFGYDQDNELYMCQLSSLGGKIYKLQRGGTPAPRMPGLLSETGVFSDLATLSPTGGLVNYEVNSPLWSDGAHKSRWFGIPDGQKIGFQTNGEWTFPSGSVWVKHFELPVNSTNEAIRRRLETRVLVRDTNGYVYGASYKWRPDNSDAELVTGALTEQIPIALPRQIGALTSLDIGNPAAGSTRTLSDGYELTAGGADIWGASDEFRYAYEQRTGDFDVAVRISDVTQPDLYTKAGLMVRDTLNANARHIFALVFPSNAARNNNSGGYEFQTRDTTGGGATAIYPPAPQPRVNFPNTWLRLKRQGNVWTAYSGGDGETWSPYATKTLALPQTVYFGVALTAHTTGAKAVASFRFRESRDQLWYFPSRQDCLSCHTRPSGGVLGMKTRQSNGDHLFLPAGVTDNQLRAWNHAGYFDPPVNEAAIASLLKLVTVTNQTSELEFRVRSYLDANCSHCHRPGGARANWDARIETPLGLANIVGGLVLDDLGITGARIIAPQDVSRSIMHKRISTTTESFKMPPLAKNVVDRNAVAALAEWIGTLASPPQVVLTAPTAGGLYYSPVTIRLAANATSTNGAIVKVQYYAGDKPIGESSTAPFTLDWLATQNGFLEITAFATDAAGLTGRSAPVSLTIIGAGTPGLLAEYFDNMNLTAKKLTRVDPTVDFDWGNNSPAPEIGPDTFSARWTGRIRPTASQTYTFYTTADDGVRLWVDNRQIINRWVDQSPTTWTGTIALTAGQLYDIRMEMYENGGGAVARLEWSAFGVTRQVVPATALLPPAPPNSPPVIQWRTPLADAIFFGPIGIPLEVTPTDSDGTIAKVEFFANGAKLGEVTRTPYVWNWSNPGFGTHSLVARATDDDNATSESSARTVTVRPLAPGAKVTATGQLELTCAATDGQSYQVERSPNLINWEPVRVIIAADGVARFSEAISPDTGRFYRVVPLP